MGFLWHDKYQFTADILSSRKPKLPSSFLPQYTQVIPYLLYAYITIRFLIKRERRIFMEHEIVHDNAVPVRYVIEFIIESQYNIKYLRKNCQLLMYLIRL